MQHHAESSTMHELYYNARARWHQVMYTGGTQQIVSVNYLLGSGVRHLQTADLQTCRLADLQTCRPGESAHQ